AKVDVSFTDGTTSAGDFDHTSQSVTFAANSTTPQTVSVPITDDHIVEGAETFTAALALDASTPLTGYSTDLTDTGAGTINDNATQPTPNRGGERGTTHPPLCFSRSQIKTRPPPRLPTPPDTSNGTATAPSDYTAVLGQTVTFPANSTADQTVTVSVNGDTTV